MRSEPSAPARAPDNHFRKMKKELNSISTNLDNLENVNQSIPTPLYETCKFYKHQLTDKCL